MWLQAGSVEASYVAFQLVGIPVFRTGSVLSLPGVTIEVAEACSGIRSSLVMLGVSLVAGHLFLRSARSKVLLFSGHPSPAHRQERSPDRDPHAPLGVRRSAVSRGKSPPPGWSRIFPPRAGSPGPHPPGAAGIGADGEENTGRRDSGGHYAVVAAGVPGWVRCQSVADSISESPPFRAPASPGQSDSERGRSG